MSLSVTIQPTRLPRKLKKVYRTDTKWRRRFINWIARHSYQRHTPGTQFWSVRKDGQTKRFQVKRQGRYITIKLKYF